MGRQYRSPKLAGLGNNQFREFVGPVPGSSADTTVIPNYGVTDISTWAASTYPMAPPVQGVIKTIVSSATAPAARVIQLSTSETQTVTCHIPGGVTTGASGNTHIGIAATTLDICLTLMGYNSTHWVIVSLFPAVALGSTGVSILST